MRTVQYIPGAIGPAPNPHTIPTGAPDIEAVVSAEIIRLPTALCNSVAHPAGNVLAAFANHPAAEIAACFAAHAPGLVAAAFQVHAAALVVGCVIPHTDAEVVAALNPHAVHAHDLLVAVGAVAGGEAYGASAGLNDFVVAAIARTILGNQPTGGVRNIAAEQPHTASGVPVPHNAGAVVGHLAAADVAHVASGTDLGHTATAVAVAHAAAAAPVVAATPVRVDARHFTLTEATLVGDLLRFSYFEVGERVLVS